jgi:hypothetical protein
MMNVQNYAQIFPQPSFITTSGNNGTTPNFIELLKSRGIEANQAYNNLVNERNQHSSGFQNGVSLDMNTIARNQIPHNIYSSNLIMQNQLDGKLATSSKAPPTVHKDPNIGNNPINTSASVSLGRIPPSPIEISCQSVEFISTSTYPTIINESGNSSIQNSDSDKDREDTSTTTATTTTTLHQKKDDNPADNLASIAKEKEVINFMLTLYLYCTSTHDIFSSLCIADTKFEKKIKFH